MFKRGDLAVIVPGSAWSKSSCRTYSGLVEIINVFLHSCTAQILNGGTSHGRIVSVSYNVLYQLENDR